MRPIRLFTLVGASVGAALTAGAFFQPEGADTAALAPTATPAPAVAGLAGVAATARLAPDSPATPKPPTAAQTPAQADPCSPQLDLAAGPDAMLALSLSAPCAAGAAVTIAHGPLRLTERLGPDGRLTLELPALTDLAEVGVAWPDGHRLAAQTPVPDFGRFARLAVQWTGPVSLELNAYAGDAAWGEAGHVHAGSPRLAEAGFVTPLGRDDGRAVVYTFPAGHDPAAPGLTLEGEIALTADSCGQRMAAQAHLVQAGAPVGLRRLALQMPPCGATGAFVLLPALLPEGAPGDRTDDPLDLAALN